MKQEGAQKGERKGEREGEWAGQREEEGEGSGEAREGGLWRAGRKRLGPGEYTRSKGASNQASASDQQKKPQTDRQAVRKVDGRNHSPAGGRVNTANN